jgi:hypothetical protein
MTESLTHDVFISYARRDDTDRRVWLVTFGRRSAENFHGRSFGVPRRLDRSPRPSPSNPA